MREHRDLLIQIHWYLAWVLHSGAESRKGSRGNDDASGRISQQALLTLLEHFLSSEGHKPALAKTLFQGMVERVVAIVSRVQGTFEFEVQPLREYFAARFLFETAPYSPPGDEKKGTRPDRFDAIARSFYWFNVTRFYAGCYSKGELPSLIERLQDLVADEHYRRLSHPRVLASTLLADWVFSQHPKSVREVVRLIIDGIGLRFLLSSTSRRVGSYQPLTLPPDCGNEELVSHCVEILSSRPAADYAADVIDLLNGNAKPQAIDAAWLSLVMKSKPADLPAMLGFGRLMGAVGRIPIEQLERVVAGVEDVSAVVETLLSASIRHFRSL